jgi:capsular polysaccharide biosynthesis protein
MIYGKEPFDLRLTVLCMLRALPVILFCTVLGTAVFGGGYYIKNVIFRGETLYAATSTYRVEYRAEEKDIGSVYINQTSWNTYMQSELFLDAVWKHLTDGEGEASGWNMDQAAIGETLEAFLASDLRVPSTTVTTNDPEKSIQIARAVEDAMTQDFAGEIREIASVVVIDPGDSAAMVIPDVRVGRALVLSGGLSCFFTVVILLLQIIGEDRIRLPGTIWKRYGVRAVGTLESAELGENLRYFFRDEAQGKEAENHGGILNNVAVCPVQEGIDMHKVLEGLYQACPEIGMDREEEGAEEGKGWFAVESPLIRPESCRKLREAEGILLVVRADRHGGRRLEHVLEYLRQQDCQVTAALLWEADEWLIKWYYGAIPGGKHKSGKANE